MPHLKSLVERYKSEGFTILGINTDYDRDEYRELIEKNEISWRSAWEGSTSGAISTRWAVDSFPTKYLIDARGVIRYTNEELWGGESLERAIETLIREMKDSK